MCIEIEKRSFIYVVIFLFVEGKVFNVRQILNMLRTIILNNP